MDRIEQIGPQDHPLTFSVCFSLTVWDKAAVGSKSQEHVAQSFLSNFGQSSSAVRNSVEYDTR